MTRFEREVHERAIRRFECEGHDGWSLFVQFREKQLGVPTILAVGQEELECRLAYEREHLRGESWQEEPKISDAGAVVSGRSPT